MSLRIHELAKRINMEGKDLLALLKKRNWVAADTTYARLGEYLARILSWYEKGGFTDELGVVHTSGYHYTFDYWEAFNEMEGVPSVADYCKRYDAVVTAMAAVFS